jgi:type I restriction enzyme S subunit
MDYFFGRSGLTFQQEGAVVKRLGDVVSYASDGPFGSKLKTSHYSSDGARVVRLQNIGERRFNDDDKAFIPVEYYEELIRYAVLPNDILVAGLGDDGHPVGRACLMPESATPAVNKADCFCIRADTDQLRQEFLYWFLNSPYAMQQVNERSQGSTRLRVNVGNFKTIEVPIPALEVQDSIVGTLKSAQRALFHAEEKYVASSRALVALRESLLSMGTKT